MSRTNRKNLSDANYREVRKGRKGWDWIDAFHGRQRHRGGMLMSQSNTGTWDDESSRNPTGRNIERRTIKRRERRIAMKDQEV